MENIKFFSIGEHSGAAEKYPGYIPAVRFGADKLPGCMYSETGWLAQTFDGTGKNLKLHKSDELYMFIGTDVSNPESLNAEITFQIENDVLTLTRTCAVFVPGGLAHGRLTVKSLSKPVMIHTCHTETDTYYAEPAEAASAAGTYAANKIEGYLPPSGKLPDAPEGFLQLLLYLDGERLGDAPYMETVWFKTSNNTGPAPHEHDFDEFIGFIGTDPSRPEELGARVEFYIGGERVSFTKSTLVYIPRGVRHSPILVPEMELPIIHFSGGNKGGYVRRGADSDSNMYKPE